MEPQVATPSQLTITVKCLRSELVFVEKQKPFKSYIFELSSSAGHRWQVPGRYSELFALYLYISKQFPKHKLSPFPPKVNPFKSEATIIQERQTAFETILNEMFSYRDIVESFPLLYYFKVKDQLYGKYNNQGINQGVLWIKVIEAVGLELEENPKADVSPQLKMRVSVPLNHSYHPPTLATQVFNNNKHAKWFEEFSVSLPNKEFPIQFKVWNHRTLASNQLLGRFELDIRPFASNQVHDLWLQISKTARLHVMFQFSETVLPSEPKKQINLKLPDLRLVLDRTVYVPGETVTGGVLYNVGNPLSVKNIALELCGTEHSEWRKSHTESRTDRDGHTRSETVWKTYQQTITLFNVTQILFAEKPTIDSGSYYWPFSFTLPMNLPPSMKYYGSHISYHARVIVHRPGLSSTNHVTTPFEVAVNYVSMYNSPAVAHEEKKLTFRSKDQVVAITGVLDGNTNVVTMGSTRKFNLTIDNRSEYDVKKMNMTLNAKGHLHAYGRSDSFSWSSSLLEIDEKSLIKLPKGHNILQTEVPITFPINTLPSLFKEFTPLIHIEYYIEIDCTMTGFLTGSVSTIIPIIFNKMPPPTLIQVPAFEPSAPTVEPVLSYEFQANGVTPLPPMDPELFAQQYGVNYQELNQTPGSTPQND